MKPIYKSGDSTSGFNYRPIALLPIVSKVLEKIIYNRLIALVGVNLSPMQFGFLPQCSTVQQMLTMLSVIFNALDSKQSVDCVYLDFRKAFNSVSHNKLLLKLWNVGVIGSLWDWLRVYLTKGANVLTLTVPPPTY